MAGHAAGADANLNQGALESLLSLFVLEHDECVLNEDLTLL